MHSQTGNILNVFMDQITKNACKKKKKTVLRMSAQNYCFWINLQLKVKGLGASLQITDCAVKLAI